MVNTTGATFLGLTIGCARCHNHKFDPISQRDYYGMWAVFAGVQHGERPMRSADQVKSQKRNERSYSTSNASACHVVGPHVVSESRQTQKMHQCRTNSHELIAPDLLGHHHVDTTRFSHFRAGRDLFLTISSFLFSYIIQTLARVPGQETAISTTIGHQFCLGRPIHVRLLVTSKQDADVLMVHQAEGSVRSNRSYRVIC